MRSSTFIGEFEVKTWDELWNFPQAFYGFCVPEGISVAQVCNKKTDNGVVRNMWGNELPKNFVFSKYEATQPFFTTCDTKTCTSCDKIRSFWKKVREARFTWICIALRRQQELGVVIPKDLIKLIAQFV